MTLADVTRLFGYWRSSPPLYDLVAHYLGFKPQGQAPAPAASAHPSIAMIKAMYPGGVVKG